MFEYTFMNQTINEMVRLLDFVAELFLSTVSCSEMVMLDFVAWLILYTVTLFPQKYFKELSKRSQL